MYNTVKKPSVNKLIEIGALIVLLLWILVFIINYINYSNDNAPILMIHTSRTCDDGKVDIYMGLGYVYRKYNSTSLTKSEFVPFWVPATKCGQSNGLPQAEEGFEIPDNPDRLSSYRGLVYFYNPSGKLLGAYKCLNSDGLCDRASSGYDQYHITYVDAFNRVEEPVVSILNDKYGFIDDSFKQDIEYGDVRYSRIIYYYDIENNKILDVFSDIKSLQIDSHGYGVGDNNIFAVKERNGSNWGLLRFKEDGTYETVLDFEYQSINYDLDTGFYILSKDDVWSVYDLNNKKYMLENIDLPIYDIWRDNNKTYYYKTGKETNISGEMLNTYQIYKFNGQGFLNKSGIVNVLGSERFIMYIDKNDNTLHILAYTLEEPEGPYQLKFYDFYKDDITHPCVEFKFSKDKRALNIKIYEGPEYKKKYEEYNIYPYYWH